MAMTRKYFMINWDFKFGIIIVYKTSGWDQSYGLGWLLYISCVRWGIMTARLKNQICYFKWYIKSNTESNEATGDLIQNRYLMLVYFVLDGHYIDVIMTTTAHQITSLTVVYSIVYSDAEQRKHQSSASLAFVRGIHRDRWIPHTKGQ